VPKGSGVFIPHRQRSFERCSVTLARRLPAAHVQRSEEEHHPRGYSNMNALLSISRAIDALNERVGRTVLWLVLIVAIVSAGNALYRYAFHMSSNAWLELQWYLFGAIFLLCAGYTLRHDEHIRIDVVASRFSRRTQIWIDVFGSIFFLLPMAILIMWLSWPVFMNAWHSGEMSSNAGGLIRWPARLLIPVGFFLLVLQGFSELIKRVAFLKGLIPDPGEKHKDPALELLEEQQAELQAAEAAAKGATK
jgi:TRAP-type mannitol/chloroaromatic compound transport system permease small subunit